MQGQIFEMSRHSTQISHSRMKPASQRLSRSRTVCSSMIVTLPRVSRTKSPRMTAPATQKHTMTPLSIVVPIAESRFGAACGGVALGGSARHAVC